ncbi:MAG: homoserine dehydrogenase [Clostridia bacterium]|nr:homoserine dehydrogenase [Clostridia bacterium]
MKHIAIFGYGVVGGGVTSVIEENREAIARVVGDEVDVKYILDLRDFPDSPYGGRVVHDASVIMDDPDVCLVAETMGGSPPAFELSTEALSRGKHVVTSNKEVVANFGDRLLACAAENGVSYLFEASVGGGIPVIRPFLTSLSGDTVVGINGILNGTNFILSKMKSEKRAFDDVLKEAQVLGYAERDPSADVDGIDAKRKIMILTALATGILPDEGDVYAESISGITPEDVSAAERAGRVIKLIGSFRYEKGSPAIFVCPQMVKKDDILAGVDDVYNAIRVRCSVTGDVMFYGRGAGRFPTAGAVTADIVAALSGAAAAEHAPIFTKKSGSVADFDRVRFSYYIRLAGVSPSDAKEDLSRYFDRVEPVPGSPAGKAEFICGEASGKELRAFLSSRENVESVIRLAEQIG